MYTGQAVRIRIKHATVLCALKRNDADIDPELVPVAAIEYAKERSEEPSPRMIGLQLAKRARYWCMAGEFEQADLSLNAAREYQHDQVQNQIELAVVTCILQRGDSEITPDLVPQTLIEQTLAQTHDASQTAGLELLRAELLIKSDQYDEAVVLIERAERRLNEAGVLESHPHWRTVARLRDMFTIE